MREKTAQEIINEVVEEEKINKQEALALVKRLKKEEKKENERKFKKRRKWK